MCKHFSVEYSCRLFKVLVQPFPYISHFNQIAFYLFLTWDLTSKWSLYYIISLCKEDEEEHCICSSAECNVSILPFTLVLVNITLLSSLNMPIVRSILIKP